MMYFARGLWGPWKTAHKARLWLSGILYRWYVAAADWQWRETMATINDSLAHPSTHTLNSRPFIPPEMHMQNAARTGQIAFENGIVGHLPFRRKYSQQCECENVALAKVNFVFALPSGDGERAHERFGCTRCG